MMTQMESLARIMGAFAAGKMPTQSQTNSWIDTTVRQIDTLSNVAQDPSYGRLSDHGQRVTEDLKQLLLAYKALGSAKNGDDLFQTAVYDLSRAELRGDSNLQQSQQEALSDAQRASEAARNVLFFFVTHFTSKDGGLGDLASFARTFLADTAEVVEQHAGSVKSQLRQTEAEVQEGKRDPLGREVRPEDESDDPRQRFERGMDTAKAAGSNVIGGGQAVKGSADQLGSKVSQDMDNFVENILVNAENNEGYRNSVLTIFDIASKWFNKSVDTMDTNTVNDIIDDPSGRVSNAMNCLNTLMERLASKSSKDLLDALRITARDVREDPEVHRYFDDAHSFMRRSLAEPTFLRSEEHVQQRRELSERWRQLQTGEQHRKWHDDLERLQREYKEFFTRIENDPDVRRINEASLVLGKDIADAALSLREAALGNANWMWQDFMDVYVPRALDVLKGTPIPRTEYKDTDTEFVMEDLIIDTFKVLPGKANIHNATDFGVSKSSVGADAKTDVKSYTNVHLKGVQLQARDVSFWINDKTLKPVSEISGLLGVNIPKEGIDVEIGLTLLPQPDKKEARRESEHAFFKVEKVRVSLNQPEFTVRKSNHPILFTAFKPIIRSRIEKTVETALEQQITVAVETIDNILFDVNRRAGVFRDTGMPLSASYISAVWSQIGHMRQQPGLLTGLRTTSVGIIKDDPRQDSKVAIGAQPQIISGDKHGPVAPGSNSQEKRDQAVRLAQESKGRAGGVNERASSGVVSFAEEVKIKRDEEMKQEGWKSNAFDSTVLSR